MAFSWPSETDCTLPRVTRDELWGENARVQSWGTVKGVSLVLAVGESLRLRKKREEWTLNMSQNFPIAFTNKKIYWHNVIFVQSGRVSVRETEQITELSAKR